MLILLKITIMLFWGGIIIFCGRMVEIRNKKSSCQLLIDMVCKITNRIYRRKKYQSGVGLKRTNRDNSYYNYINSEILLL